MTLKPAAWMCGKCAARFTKDNRRLCCSNAHDGVIASVNVPLFTRDDLVRVARFTVDETSSLAPQDIDAEAEEIVCRMLGEKVVEEPCAHAHTETNLPLMAWVCVDCGVVTETFLEVAKKARDAR
jgi:hypothetical protein